MNISAIKTRIFRQGEDLCAFIFEHIPNIEENSIIVVTSKIVALAENRTVKRDSQTKEELIRQESDIAIPSAHCWLTIKDGMMMASAGIDESNANGNYILLPKDSFISAHAIRNYLKKVHGLKNIGVLITDSRTIPLRAGVTGVALGYAGFCGIRDYRGKPDIFGRILKMSRTNVADSVATAAVFLMGEGDEQQPLAVIKNVPVEFTEKGNKNELYIALEDDMYKPLFTQFLAAEYNPQNTLPNPANNDTV